MEVPCFCLEGTIAIWILFSKHLPRQNTPLIITHTYTELLSLEQVFADDHFIV